MTETTTNHRTTSAQTLATALAEPYAFALVTWPAIIGLLAPMPEEWSSWATGGLVLWLAAMHLAAYTAGRGPGFGNVMLFSSGIVGLACHTYPSAWTLAWLPALLITLHAAQRARLKVLDAAEETPAGDTTSVRSGSAVPE